MIQVRDGKLHMHTVLLIEDNRLVKIVYERMLSRAGYKVVSAADGEEALKLAHQGAPDVILLDMMLPRVSGPEVLRFLKHDPATKHTPVIVVTGLSKKNADKLLSEGASAFVEKEQLLESGEPLLQAVERVLQAEARKKALGKDEATLPWTATDIALATASNESSTTHKVQ
jgi:CheY-like chemotaxis protein